MVKLLLGLDAIPKPHDAADALAVAICHLHNGKVTAIAKKTRAASGTIRSWRDYRPATK
jgi:crossover junction endodeoxyribonuclease RuvC